MQLLVDGANNLVGDSLGESEDGSSLYKRGEVRSAQLGEKETADSPCSNAK